MVTALTNLIDRARVPLAVVQLAPPLRHANAAFLALAGPPPWALLEPAIARLFDIGAPVEADGGQAARASVHFSLWPLHHTGAGGPAAALIVGFPAASPELGLSAKAVHDLRGSLNNIGLSVELLLRAPLSPADRAARLRELRDLVDTAGRLVERLPAHPAHRSETV